ncbi:hypothetical protein Patl1_33115 [Pistacia atlantica]|uniref:Uncharacterized protein n=1 Tax=Pistacia atlantica TaxID=434234 RepID=A0ACC1AM46_9ROSI|nr:hypothetical protein Patl1_33115 [Pistacia atlantica]
MNGEVVVADEIARAIKCVMESDNEPDNTMALSLKNEVCRGFGGFGALGHSVYHRGLFPRLVEGSWNGKIRHIATSGTHTAAIS